MKKLILFLVCSIFSSLSVSVNATEPENEQGAEIRVINVEKHGGRRCFFGIIGAVKYNDVKYTSAVKYVVNPNTGQTDRVVITDIICEGPGNESCDYHGGISVKTSVANDIDIFFNNIINSILWQIDENLLENEIYSGSIRKKYMFIPEGNMPVFFVC